MDDESRKIVNGNMANSMEEVKLLGKQMENMRDDQQLVEDDRIPDPRQFDDKDKN
ncbi:multidrug ABC transporter ATPase [Solibacillus sp. FSL H8-0538]|uniref:multidrug ABC transporter ATPase n=1 Tax=Solibacillus sp. FSL H8-0538 TaxID=2921400 RepID=UPI0030FA97A6